MTKGRANWMYLTEKSTSSRLNLRNSLEILPTLATDCLYTTLNNQSTGGEI